VKVPPGYRGEPATLLQQLALTEENRFPHRFHLQGHSENKDIDMRIKNSIKDLSTYIYF
jgi:hypothetical protein